MPAGLEVDVGPAGGARRSTQKDVACVKSIPPEIGAFWDVTLLDAPYEQGRPKWLSLYALP
jgi:hypothetical protein